MKTVVILSGGIDSSTLLYKVKQTYDTIFGITFDYGQRHQIELDAARNIAKEAQIHSHTVMRIPKLLGSALTGNGEIPKEGYSVETQKATVVPNRNMVFLSIAANLAYTRGSEVIFYGAHAGNHAVYPDCTPKFVEATEHAINVGNYGDMIIFAPFINMKKWEIVKLGDELGVPFDLTWSCYDPQWVYGDPCHCGTCITGDARVTMSDFTRVLLRDVSLGSTIIAPDEFGRKGYGRTLNLATIIGKRYIGVKPVVKLIFDDRELTCTADHPILGPTSYNYLDWRKAGKQYKYMETRILDSSIDNMEAYNRGWLRGICDADAHDGGYVIYLAQKNKRILNNAEVIAIQQGFKTSYRTRDCSASKLKGIKEIPELCITGRIPHENSRDFKVGYLAGFTVGDGTLSTDRNIRIEVGEHHTNWERVYDYMEDIGIIPNIQAKTKTTNLGVIDSIKLIVGSRGLLRIPILYGDKKTSIYYDYLDRITLRSLEKKPYTIESAGKAEVWDIQTTSGTFFAEGIAVHNCGTCRERKSAFKKAAIHDPTRYAK